MTAVTSACEHCMYTQGVCKLCVCVHRVCANQVSVRGISVCTPCMYELCLCVQRVCVCTMCAHSASVCAQCMFALTETSAFVCAQCVCGSSRRLCGAVCDMKYWLRLSPRQILQEARNGDSRIGTHSSGELAPSVALF